MCISLKNKWTKFIPTTEYLSAVKNLTTVDKLYQFIQQFQYTGEKGDTWQDPEQFLKNEHLDCDDFMRFTVDVLVRVMGIEAKGIISSGYDFARWGNKIWNVKCHAITVFPYGGKFALFSNQEFKTGYNSYEDACKYTFPDGLKSMVVRDWEGKVESKQYKLIGTF